MTEREEAIKHLMTCRFTREDAELLAESVVTLAGAAATYGVNVNGQKYSKENG